MHLPLPSIPPNTKNCDFSRQSLKSSIGRTPYWTPFKKVLALDPAIAPAQVKVESVKPKDHFGSRHCYLVGHFVSD